VREHPLEPDPDEPEDGWVISPELFDGEITTIELCRWTGSRRAFGGTCPLAHRHAPGECAALFVQADALVKAGLVPPETFELAAQVLGR
jgi:hypothetical protein